MYLRHQELAARFVTNWCFHAPCEIDGSNQPMLKTHNLANKLYKQRVEKHCVCPIYSTVSVCRQKLSHWTNVENYRSLLINTYLWQSFVYIRCPVTNSITTLFIGDRAGGDCFGRNISHYTIISIVFHNYLHFDINILILFIYYFRRFATSLRPFKNKRMKCVEIQTPSTEFFCILEFISIIFCLSNIYLEIIF